MGEILGPQASARRFGMEVTKSAAFAVVSQWPTFQESGST